MTIPKTEIKGIFERIALAAVCSLLFVSVFCRADDFVRAGTVVAARGNITNGTGHPLLQGSNVYIGDEITTLEKSFVVIQFYDGAKITVRPASTIVIDAYTPEKSQISLVEGGLRVITGALAKEDPDSYKIKTPVALLGVRGTEFAVMLCDKKVCEIDVK